MTEREVFEELMVALPSFGEMLAGRRVTSLKVFRAAAGEHPGQRPYVVRVGVDVPGGPSAYARLELSPEYIEDQVAKVKALRSYLRYVLIQALERVFDEGSR